MGQKAWQLGAPGTIAYRLYDGLRSRLNQRLVQYLLTEGLRGDKNIVLEAGSGPAFASSILARDPRVELSVAVDIDLEALKEARRRDPSLALVAADLLRLPFRDRSVDLCWNSSTIEHLDNPQEAPLEMARITRQDGTVFVGVPNLYGPLGFQRRIEGTGVGVWIGRTYSYAELKDMMTTAGLKPRDRIFYFFRFFVGLLAEK
jgi:SAM-dependent methyltransferase